MFLVSKCPYCQTEKIPLNIKGITGADNRKAYIFTACNHCEKPTIFLIYRNISYDSGSYITLPNISLLDIQRQESINDYFKIEEIIRPPTNLSYQCPEHVPETVKAKFDEAAQCQASDCLIASGIMLRLCLETTTKDLLETDKERGETLSEQIQILFKKKKIDEDIKNFADEIRLDGNYAVHEGKMDQDNLTDLFDFTIDLLKYVYTRQNTLKLSRERRNQRKKQGAEK